MQQKWIDDNVITPLDKTAIHRLVLLQMIADSTRKSGKDTLYFVPRNKGNWSSILSKSIAVWGSGDAAILRKFERSGFTENANSQLNPYCCRITENGREELAVLKRRWDKFHAAAHKADLEKEWLHNA
jgi:hypothetical protein